MDASDFKERNLFQLEESHFQKFELLITLRIHITHKHHRKHILQSLGINASNTPLTTLGNLNH